MQGPTDNPDICTDYSLLSWPLRVMLNWFLPEDLKIILSCEDRDPTLFQALFNLPNIVKDIPNINKRYGVLASQLSALKNLPDPNLYNCIKVIDPDFKFFPENIRTILCFFQTNNVSDDAMQQILNVFLQILIDPIQKNRILPYILDYYNQKNTIAKIFINLAGCFWEFEYAYLYVFLEVLAPFCLSINTLHLRLNTPDDLKFLLNILKNNPQITTVIIEDINTQCLECLKELNAQIHISPFTKIHTLRIHKVTQESARENPTKACENLNKFLNLFLSLKHIHVADNSHVNLSPLLKCTSIESLILESSQGLHDNYENFQYLCTLINNNTSSLKIVSLMASLLTTGQIEELIEILKQCKHLTSLNLSYNNVNETIVLKLAQAINSWPNLLSLNISGNHIFEITCLKQLVKNIAICCLNFTSFICANVKCLDATIDNKLALELANLFSKLFYLRIVDLGQYNMSLEAIKCFLEKCQSLDSFNMVGCAREVMNKELVKVVKAHPFLVDAGPSQNL